jgi:hypothetical protein
MRQILKANKAAGGYARQCAANKTKGPSAGPGPSTADCRRTEQRRELTRGTRATSPKTARRFDPKSICSAPFRSSGIFVAMCFGRQRYVLSQTQSL